MEVSSVPAAPTSLDQGTLLDGKPPALPEEVHRKLDSLAIEFTCIDHPPMRTVEDSKHYRGDVAGGYSKNLFLRNKKGKMWLVTLHEDRVIDLKILGELIGSGRVSFASETRLMNYLGIRPGAVSPLAVINDTSLSVAAVLDASLLQHDPLHFHPCDNSKTTTVAAQDLLRYMSACQHTPDIIDFDTAR